jgi:hypothetical protein
MAAFCLAAQVSPIGVVLEIIVLKVHQPFLFHVQLGALMIKVD